MFPAADELRYRAHRAINAPGTRLEQQQRDDTENAGGQHDAVKSKSKLRDPWLRTAAVSPVPWYVKSPQQADCLMKIDSMGKDQVGRNQHIDKHRCKKQQEAMISGMKKHSSPSQAKRILKKPRARYSAVRTQR